MVDERTRLRRRYLSLGAGELAAAAAFALVAAATLGPRLDGRETAALWSALTPLLVVLVQAGAYWLIARGYVGRAPMPALVAATYRVVRAADVVLLLAGLAGVLAWWPDRAPVGAGVLAVWAFGVVEYVNYFVVRLAYPARHWFARVTAWRTPRLVSDLRGASTG